MTGLLKLHNSCRYCRRNFLTSSAKLSASAKNDEIPAINYFASRYMRDYFYKRGLPDEEQAKIPESYVKRNIHARSFIIADPQLAKKAGFTICSRLSGEHVLEFDPGIGLMSEVLLMAAPNLRLYEQNAAMSGVLKEKFSDQIGEKVKIFNKNFNALKGLMVSDEEESKKVIACLFEDIPLKSWNNDITISFILHAVHRKTIKFLLYNLILDDRLKQFGRPEFFIFLDKTLYPLIAARPDNEYTNHYRRLPILFQLFFEIKILLDGLPRKSFLPWPGENKKGRYSRDLSGEMLLLHVIPKTNMFDPCRYRNFVEILLVFVKSYIRHRKPVITTLERLVPNCGPQFILEDGLTTYTEFLELPPEKILSIFERLTQYPEFDPTILRSIVGQDDLRLWLDDESENEKPKSL